MGEQLSEVRRSKAQSQTRQARSDQQSNAKRYALLVAGASAVAVGIWKRGRIGWPVVAGGAVLLSRAAAKAIPRELSCEVSQTINRSAADVYAFMREFNNWPAYMKGVKSVRNADANTIVWTLAGNRGEGRSTITESTADSNLRWSTILNGESYQSSIQFRPAPGNRGTEVHWHIRATGPQKAISEILQSATGGSLEQHARESLRAAKQLLETGEVATADGQPHGTRGLQGKALRAIFRESADDKRRPSRVTDLPGEQLTAS